MAGLAPAAFNFFQVLSMPISYPEILQEKNEGVVFSWDERDVMLYAMGVGMGADPLCEKELPFVFEKELRVLPTFTSIIARNAAIQPAGLNRALVLDGQRDLVMHRPLPAKGKVVMDARVLAVSDKGQGKGAIIKREVVLRDAETGEDVATLFSYMFARGDGGFGGPTESLQDDGARPDGPPDQSVEIATRPDQALLYRLSGDWNPLHADPQFAARAGFDRPILHGLCVYGICCRAVLQAYADYNPALLRRFAVRFSAPCLPGDTIVIDFWERGDTIYFDASVKERKVTIVKNGSAILGPSACQ